MKVLYLDESGEHNPRVRDPHYPIFVLGGVIIDKDHADGTLTQLFNAFKQEVFGNTDIVLHTADMSRNRKGFEALQDPAFRAAFYNKMNTLMRRLEYRVIACAIRKDRPTFQEFAVRDLYMVCFDRLVDVFCEEVGEVRDGGMIMAEKRGSRPLDRALEIEWINLKTYGTSHTPGSVISDRVLALNLRAKMDNIAGLQMADLVVSPIGRHCLGKRDAEDWQIVAGKLLRDGSGQEEPDGMIVVA
jgi:hypothetical protein